jgi:putative ABC transport system substrate-binding protein
VTLIATVGASAALAAQAATTEIPVVFAIGGDPVKFGLVTSLARPGRNLTGLTFLVNTLIAKRFEVLQEAVPLARKFAFLVNRNSPNTEPEAIEARAIVEAKGQQLIVASAGNSDDLANAVASSVRQGAMALCVQADQMLLLPPGPIVKLAADHALPTVYSSREVVSAGGLISNGTSQREAYQLLGGYAARILRGEKPGDLPVQQAVKVELAVNLRTARSLGLELPQTLLARADEVIE